MDRLSTEVPKGTKESDEMLTPILKSIGYVATGWARLEHSINRVIWSLASMDDKDGACVTAQIPGLLPRMRALIALAHRHGCGDVLLKDLNKFSSRIDGLARKRNRIVHDPWYVKSDGSQFGRLEITADRRLVFEVQPETPTEVLLVASDIAEAGVDFGKLHDRIKAEVVDSLKGQIEEHLGTGSADFLGQPDPDTEPEAPRPPPRSSRE